MIGIVTDSNAQLPAELVDRYGIEVVPLTVTVDGTSYAEGVDLDPDDFYARFESASPSVSTAQPSPGRFTEAYARMAERGVSEVLSIHVGARVSGTLNSARLAAADSPVPVRLVDTGTASFGVGCCVWAAAAALERGVGANKAAAEAAELASVIGNVFIVSALDLVRAGGRLASDVEAGPQSVPILSLVDGEIRAVATADDVDQAVQAMARYVTSAGQSLNVAVGTADREAAELSASLEAALADDPRVQEVIRYRIGPSVGAHTGPGTAGAFFYPVR